MGLFLTVAGILLMTLAWREMRLTLSRPIGPEAGFPSGGDLPGLEWPAELTEEIRLVHSKLDVLTGLVGEAVDGIRTLDGARDQHVNGLDTVGLGFGQVLANEQQSDLYRQVYQAFDAGKNVTEIARELQRGRGEIELILSLRR